MYRKSLSLSVITSPSYRAKLCEGKYGGAVHVALARSKSLSENHSQNPLINALYANDVIPLSK